jgi:hypothetical protein
MWRKGDPVWWIRVAEDMASCCCFGGDGFGVREEYLGAEYTYRAMGTTGSSELKPVCQAQVMVQVQSRALASVPA